MNVEVGNYQFPKEVGYKGWVTFEKHIAFEKMDGQIVVIEKPN